MRGTWTEALEIVAAAQINTIQQYGPDRNIGFSPIPAKSMASHVSGARYIELLGGVMTSFTTGTRTFPLPPRTSLAIRPMCANPATGGTPPT